MRRFWLIVVASLSVVPAFAQVTVTVTPSQASVHVGTVQQFTARVSGTTTTTVRWSVSLPEGATGSPGTISTAGRYTPPGTLPKPNTVVVTATSNADPTVSANVPVAVLNPYPTLASAKPAVIAATGPFTLTLNGSGFVPGAQALVGGTPLPTTYISATRLTVTGNATELPAGTVIPIVVQNPDPGAAATVSTLAIQVASPAGPTVVDYGVAAHFLDQAAFGPDAAGIARVQQLGLDDYINEQFTVPASLYPAPSTTGVGVNQIQARFFTNAVHGQDQLRQRVAFALSQIFVVSATEENTPTQLVPWLEMLRNDAFANFRTIMRDVTLHPTMGEYLDMRNNDKADPTRNTLANENYARELLQLFTIGLSQLNPDGTLKLGKDGKPIPTYDQKTIQEFAKVYTGWTYPTKPGATLQKHNPAYFIGPMVPFESNHDRTSKTLLNGVVLPAGQNAQADLDAALDNIFSHPNVAPFISKQLIQHLVSSNPSSEYVGRVAAVFNNNGDGIRGDMKAVIKAILLDPEARRSDGGPFSFLYTPIDPAGGHLREPVFMLAAALRGLGASVNDTNNLTAQATALGQTIFTPPSVFNYFAPSYQLPPEYTPAVSLTAPEFQLNSPSAAIARFNVVNTMVYGNLGAGAVIDFAPFSSLGGNGPALVDLLSKTFFYGQMPPQIQVELLSAMDAIKGNTAPASLARAQAAIYLSLSSAYYNVEH